jgi:hypothetical protein
LEITGIFFCFNVDFNRKRQCCQRDIVFISIIDDDDEYSGTDVNDVDDIDDAIAQSRCNNTTNARRQTEVKILCTNYSIDVEWKCLVAGF